MEDDTEARVQALEEQMKLGQIDQATFEQLRDTITGGDIGATHLVKGLDRKLLERVRRREDVLGGAKDGPATAEKTEAEAAFEELEQKEVAPMQKEETVKKGEMAPPPPPKPVAGVKRSRNDILAEMRASRKAAEEAKAAALPKLGDRFRKIGAKKNGYPRIEHDDKGREVLITMDEHGRVKRKVRKIEEKAEKAVPTDGRERDEKGLLMIDKKAKKLGMDDGVVVPDVPMKAVDEDEDDDIFAGVGHEYDPLKDELEAAGEVSSSEEGEEEGEAAPSLNAADTTQPPPLPPGPGEEASPPAAEVSPASAASPWSEDTTPPESPSAVPQSPTAEPSETTDNATMPPSLPKRNYFNTNPSTSTSQPTTTDTTDTTSSAPFKDPTILAALKRASAIASRTEGDDAQKKPGAESTAAQRLLAQQRDRDYEDMDMGFGASRAGDEEDAEEGGTRVKLSEWRGLSGEGDGDGDGKKDGKGKDKGGAQRKRGKKKRMGDKNNASDVLKVIEGRKKG